MNHGPLAPPQLQTHNPENADRGKQTHTRGKEENRKEQRENILSPNKITKF